MNFEFIKELEVINSLNDEFGNIKEEYDFYKNILGTFENKLSEETSSNDYEIWREYYPDFIKKIIVEDEIYWNIYDMLSEKAKEFINDIKAKDGD